MLRMLLNVLWIVFGGGFIIWLEYILAGVVLCITIVGIPFGVQCFKIAGIGLLPFGKNIERDPNVRFFGTLGNRPVVSVRGLVDFSQPRRSRDRIGGDD